MDAVTPQQAATIRVGQSVNIDGYIGLVSGLFQTVVREAEHRTLPFFKAGGIFFVLSHNPARFRCLCDGTAPLSLSIVDTN